MDSNHQWQVLDGASAVRGVIVIQQQLSAPSDGEGSSRRARIRLEGKTRPRKNVAEMGAVSGRRETQERMATGTTAAGKAVYKTQGNSMDKKGMQCPHAAAKVVDIISARVLKTDTSILSQAWRRATIDLLIGSVADPEIRHSNSASLQDRASHGPEDRGRSRKAIGCTRPWPSRARECPHGPRGTARSRLARGPVETHPSRIGSADFLSRPS
jgi:hypothetical protein